MPDGFIWVYYWRRGLERRARLLAASSGDAEHAARVLRVVEAAERSSGRLL
jgi:hypothetical protein